ncbi:hypothetical protein ACWS7L_07530 [Exiguobacterium artemiae]
MKQAEVNQELFKRAVDAIKRAWNAVKEFIGRIRENIRKAFAISQQRKCAVKSRYDVRDERRMSWYVNRLVTSESKRHPMRKQNVTRWIGRRHQ